MSLSQVRTYLKQRIAIVEPDLKEWRDAFNLENIPNTLLDTYYHIGYGLDSSSPQADKFIEDSFSVTVTIFKRGGVNIVDAVDSLMDTAHCIRMECIKQWEVSQTDNIKSVESVSIEPTEINASNDNIVQVQINFNVRLFFNSI